MCCEERNLLLLFLDLVYIEVVLNGCINIAGENDGIDSLQNCRDSVSIKSVTDLVFRILYQIIDDASAS